MMRPLVSGLVVLGLLTALAACGGGSDEGGAASTSVPTAEAGGPADAPKLAFVTNCAVEFWAVAEAGVEAAAADHDVEVVVRMPPNATPAEQKQYLEDAVATGVQGIAISPKDPDNMTQLLKTAPGNSCHCSKALTPRSF